MKKITFILRKLFISCRILLAKRLALGKYESNVTEPMSILINCWYDKAGEEYFLFVPSGLINDELHWLYTGADEVYIGNSRINNGEIYHMGSGIYEVRLCGQDYSNSFRLRITESSAINTLFLTTDSGSHEYLHETKSNSEGGEYTLYDQRGICVASGDIDEMHCRGNASWEDTDKKSYQLKLDIELKDTAFLWNKQEGFLARKDI